MTDEDVSTLKKALQTNISILVFVSILCLIWMGYSIFYQSVDEETSKWGWLSIIASGFLLFSSLYSILGYIYDLVKRRKIVIKANCKKTVHYGESISEYVKIEGYGEIGLSGYNREMYFSYFSAENEKYELHIAPRSKIILFVSKIINDKQ